MTIRRVAIHAAVVIGTLALVFLLYEFREALILFILSLAVAAATRPFVDALRARGMTRSRALILVYALFTGLILLLLGMAASQILRELQILGDSLAQTYDRMWIEWPEGTEFQRMVIGQLPAPAELYESFSIEQENSALGGLLGVTMSSATFIGQLVSVIILSLYWSIDRVHFERLWLSLLPVESRVGARNIWRSIEHDFGAYVRSEILQSLLAAILLGIGLWLMGIRYPALLALFAALAWLVPWLGGVLALVPVALTGLSQGLGMGIFATSYAIGVLFFLEFFIEPRFIRHRQYSSLLTILLIIALVEPFGLVGLIVAPPLAAAIQLVFRYNLFSRPVPEQIKEAEQISQLRARVLMIRQVVARQEEEIEPQARSLLDRLDALIERADKAVEGENPRGATNRSQA
jgi:predicted PurR-regulated permease PerM